MTHLTVWDVESVLKTFVDEYVVDIPAVHKDGEYFIRLADLEYALQAPDELWLADITDAVNERI